MMLCTYSLPIHDKTGRTVGVFAADVSLEWLTEQLHELDVMENNNGLIKAEVGDKQHTSYSFIISRTGQYIVHPERERILTGHFFDYGDSLTNKSYYQLGKNMLAGKSGYSRAKVDSINSYVFHAPLRRSGWSMAIVVPMFRLIGPGIAIGLLLLVVIAVGLIAVQLLCFYTIRRATRPLSYLAASAGEVAKGRFDAPLPELSHNDEIRLLRDSFENMQTSLAQHIRQLTDTTAQKASLERELNIARGIQMSMLPKTFPPFPERTDIDVFGQLTPAKAVGGDLFDFFIRDEQLFFCIGDVSGKGIPASLVMAMTAAQFHTLSANENRPDLIVSAINEAMTQHNDSLMFVTLFVGVLNLATGRLYYCNAGHNAPILIAGNRDIPTENGEPLDVVPNVPIGVIADYPFMLQQTTLVPGTTLLLYTDGLTEAENEQHALFDEHRVFESIGQLGNATPQQLVEHITESVHQFVGAAEQSDDLSMMAIRYQ
ncbi:MAG: SpoIIE family protein phosphatase [Prevotella sp.]|nr:SpoIIE family protein phosphatase [Prevotella sp.]